MKHFVKIPGIFLFLFFLHVSVSAQHPAGTWNGKLELGNNALNLVFHFDRDENGQGTCSMDSPDQGAKGIPARLQFIGSDSILIEISALNVSYKAQVRADSIRGTFSQSGFRFPLILVPGDIVPLRPQTPKPPYPYRIREVCFENPHAPATLCGTLTYPVGYDSLSRKKPPVVLMVSGSGLQNRDEEVFGHKPFAVIADFLARNGIASLRYDDRGMGQSTGNARSATTADFMQDARYGLDFLRKHGQFGKTGVLGHSEGGTIAFMLGGDRHADFLVCLAAPGVRGDSILVEQNRKTLILNGLEEALVDRYCQLLRILLADQIAQKPCGSPHMYLDSLQEALGFQLPREAMENLLKVQENIGNVTWLKFFISYSPLSDIRKTSCPVLALNGSLDTQVPAGSNLESIRENLPRNRKSILREYPGLNHLFQHARTGNVNEYGNIPETFSEEVLKDITDWILNL